MAARWLWPVYRELRPNLPLAAACAANLRMLGRDPLPPERIPAGRTGSTDLGNVSHLVPANNPTARWRKAQRGYRGNLIIGQDLMELPDR